MNTNIEISHITKKYKNGVTALDDVSFRVALRSITLPKNTRTVLPLLMMSAFMLAAVFLACWGTMVPEKLR